MADDGLPTGALSRVHQIIATAIACSVLSTFFVAARIYTRSRINRAIGWDDYIALVTLPFCIARGVLLGIATRYGMGISAGDFFDDLGQQYQKWIFGASCTYLLALLGYKMSILCLYLRIFDVDQLFRYRTWAVMFVTFGYLFSNMCTQIFGCRPVAKSWTPDLPGHCISTRKADYGYVSLNIISDLLIFVLPLPMVWRLQLSPRDKLGVSVIFVIGSLYVQPPSPMIFQRRVAIFSSLINGLSIISNWVVATVRFAHVVRDMTGTARPQNPVDASTWSTIEINTGLICACLPVLKPFFSQIIPKAVTDRMWPYRERRLSWFGDLRKDEGKQTHRSHMDLEHRKGTSEKVSIRSLTDSSSLDSASNRTGALGSEK